MIPDTYIATFLDILNEKGEKTTCRISGHSMAPLIQHGDTLVIEYGSQNPHIGDVLVFKKPDKAVAHRIVKIEGTGEGEVILTKGDRCSHFDDPIIRDKIIGKVVVVSKGNTQVDLTTFSSRVLNYLWARLSYISVTRQGKQSLLWKGIDFGFFLRSKLLPKNLSIKLLVFKVVTRNR